MKSPHALTRRILSLLQMEIEQGECSLRDAMAASKGASAAIEGALYEEQMAEHLIDINRARCIQQN